MLDPAEQYDMLSSSWDAIGPLELDPLVAACVQASTFKDLQLPLPVSVPGSRGRLLFDVLELLARKTIPGKVQTILPQLALLGRNACLWATVTCTRPTPQGLSLRENGRGCGRMGWTGLCACVRAREREGVFV